MFCTRPDLSLDLLVRVDLLVYHCVIIIYCSHSVLSVKQAGYAISFSQFTGHSNKSFLTCPLMILYMGRCLGLVIFTFLNLIVLFIQSFRYSPGQSFMGQLKWTSLPNHQPKTDCPWLFWVPSNILFFSICGSYFLLS